MKITIIQYVEKMSEANGKTKVNLRQWKTLVLTIPASANIEDNLRPVGSAFLVQVCFLSRWLVRLL